MRNPNSKTLVLHPITIQEVDEIFSKKEFLRVLITNIQEMTALNGLLEKYGSKFNHNWNSPKNREKRRKGLEKGKQIFFEFRGQRGTEYYCYGYSFRTYVSPSYTDLYKIIPVESEEVE